MSSIRAKFVERFGENQAIKLEAAAAKHRSALLSGHPPEDADAFQNTLLVCIGFECFTREAFAEEHGIEDGDAIKEWTIEHGDLRNYNGPPPDYLTAVGGGYREYLVDPEEAS